MLCTDALEGLTIHPALADRIPTQNIDCVGLDELIREFHRRNGWPLHCPFFSPLVVTKLLPRIRRVDVAACLTVSYRRDLRGYFPTAPHESYGAISVKRMITSGN